MAAVIDCDRLFSGKLKPKRSVRCFSLHTELSYILFPRGMKMENPSSSCRSKSFNVSTLKSMGWRRVFDESSLRAPS